MTALTAPPTAPSTDRPDDFADEADALVAWYATHVAELTAFQASLTMLAAGGFGIPYVVDTTTGDADPTAGKLRLNNATQNLSTVIRCDLVDSAGNTRTSTLDTIDDSTSAVKGHILLQGVTDPSDFILFSVTSLASPSGYKNITVAVVDSSAASPFANGDPVVLKFTRTGDASLSTTTSATSNAIPTSSLPVSKSFTVDTSRNYAAGMTLKIAATASLTNWMLAEITSYTSATGALVVSVTNSNGSGTFADWTISLSAPILITTNNSVQAKSGDFTSYTNDKGAEYNCSAALTNTLSAAATLGNGWYQYITNDSSSTVTVARSGSETFTGPAGTAATSLLIGKGMCFLILCDGANFRYFRIGSMCPVLHIREQQTSGTNGGTSVTGDFTQVRVLNTTVTNTIPGASISSNEITLPAGTYEVWARAPAYRVGPHKAALYNTADSTYTIVGSSAQAASSDEVQTDSWVVGQFVISATKTFKVRHYTNLAVVTNGLGITATTGQVEVYTEAFFKQVA